jgi:eukaryotic-like serine/threonine-protein kinase
VSSLPFEGQHPSPREPRPFTDRRYQLLEKIGAGAGGEVFRANDLGAGVPREVCIKRLSTMWSPELARAMREEARLLARIRHANVVSLLAVGEEADGAPFLALELVEGTSLRALSRLARGAIRDGVSVHVGCALLRALAVVQRALPGIVHRDVTPHNLLVSREGEVKLSDFGIALALDRARWTRPFVVKGKVGYMAPEQIRGEALDVRADLFSAGVILYELLAGARPWGDARGYQELYLVEKGAGAPLSAHRPDLPPDLLRTVGRLLAWSPADRFSSPDEALQSLALHSAGDLGPEALASIVRALQTPPKARTRREAPQP